ncbi:SWF or SNF family helicase [Streptomyces sp. WAC05374]|uniref:SWF or SNF family helicase n=1 Tax=Streptomyces sp. WAC05374 TaxID=2487420 RepID=UPI000F87B7C5|nr:SWF or SNF family helicase [Streptomyces sp. WAC05374]RST15976.1 SWF or SNF family helicase [Streptomyces sp. WAC05374]TDF47877.1 SWF or SNF family helicase [Streptomyces sp. WAC05374]TDF53972.1 SWF or SNF family helicase [Streptomyces sp. WAC05374]
MSRDEDMERTFAAPPPVPGRAFAQSWWGRAWLKALEDTALDGAQLKKGRKQAREGAVGAVSVRPGRITAVVKDRDGTARRSDVLLQELTEEEWDRFLDMAVDRAGHIAALLDRDMPPHLVEDAAAAGVELLPGIGDLEPECGCDAWDHCPHTAALCYQVARLLDQDPFVLLLMRGRGERRLLDELQARSAARAERTAPGERDERQPAAGGPDGARTDGPEGARTDGPAGVRANGPAGVRADEAFAARDILPPLPAPPLVPETPGAPPSLDTETAPPPGVDPAALERLAADAAARAHRMLVEALAAGHGDRPVPGPLTAGQDAVRLAASAAWAPEALDRLATGTGRRRADLDLATRAWRLGGADALAVLEEERTPGPELLARAGALPAEAWEDGERPALRADRPGHWTVVGTGVQVRLDAAGRWWPYREEAGRWAPAGPPAPDPATALATARADGI